MLIQRDEEQLAGQNFCAKLDLYGPELHTASADWCCHDLRLRGLLPVQRTGPRQRNVIKDGPNGCFLHDLRDPDNFPNKHDSHLGSWPLLCELCDHPYLQVYQRRRVQRHIPLRPGVLARIFVYDRHAKSHFLNCYAPAFVVCDDLFRNEVFHREIQHIVCLQTGFRLKRKQPESYSDVPNHRYYRLSAVELCISDIAWATCLFSVLCLVLHSSSIFCYLWDLTAVQVATFLPKKVCRNLCRRRRTQTVKPSDRIPQINLTERVHLNPTAASFDSNTQFEGGRKRR